MIRSLSSKYMLKKPVVDPDYRHYRSSGSPIIQKIIETRIMFLFILLL